MSLCSASYVRWQRGTARIHPPLLLSAGCAAVIDVSFPPGPQQQTCSSGFAAVGPCWGRQTDGQTDRPTDTALLPRPSSACYTGSANKKVKGSPYSITERRAPELISVLGSHPAGDVSQTRR